MYAFTVSSKKWWSLTTFLCTRFWCISISRAIWNKKSIYVCSFIITYIFHGLKLLFQAIKYFFTYKVLSIKTHAISSVLTTLFQPESVCDTKRWKWLSELGRHSRATEKTSGMTKTYYKVRVNYYNTGLRIH